MSKLAQKPETLSRAKPLYAFFHDFESRYGELAQIIKLEKRMNDLFPEDPLLVLFSRRFTSHGFNPTAIRPIISPNTQARPKTYPSNQQYYTANHTPPKVVQTGTSPKRALPLDDSDTDGGRPPKLARIESPLAGAAGRRRLDQQKRHQPPQDMSRYEGQSMAQAPAPPDLPRDVLFLLSMIPNADTYTVTKFKAEEMIKLIRETNLPSSAAQLRMPPDPVGLTTQVPVLLQQPQVQMQQTQQRSMPNMPQMPQIPQGPHMQHMQQQMSQPQQMHPMSHQHQMQQMHPMAQGPHMSMQQMQHYPQAPGQYPGGYSMFSHPPALLSPFQYTHSPTFLRPSNVRVDNVSYTCSSPHGASVSRSGRQPLSAANHQSDEVFGPQLWNPNGASFRFPGA